MRPKRPLCRPGKVNASRMDEIYDAANLGRFDVTTNVGSGSMYPLVLCDVYAQKRGGTGAKKTGTPILYFRARTNFKFQDSTDAQGTADDIYNYYDNEELLLLGLPDGTVPFTIMDNTVQTEVENFEDMIVNENVTTIRRPYRADGYILVSAGKDGDFGTADDVFNFDKEVTE